MEEARKVARDGLSEKDTHGLRVPWGVKAKVIPSKGNNLQRNTKAQILLHPGGGSPFYHQK